MKLRNNLVSRWNLAVAACCLIATLAGPAAFAVDTATIKKANPAGTVPDPASVGGEAASIVQVANLIYAGTKTSECFADHFLRRAEQDSSISTSRRLHSVKLGSDEIYNF